MAGLSACGRKENCVMRKKRIGYFVVLFIVLVLTAVITFIPGQNESERSPDELMLIAHAGGAVEGWASTNSLEALQHSAAMGHRYIEVDLMLTTDGKVVLNHDWQWVTGRTPGAPNVPVDHGTFMQYRIFGQFTPVDLDMLIGFLDEHPHVRIITVTKDETYEVLHIIPTDFPGCIDRSIPQGYSFESVPYIKALGFDDIIVTLYEVLGEEYVSAAALNALADTWRDDIFGITVPIGLLDDAYIEVLDLSVMRFFVHTINDAELARELKTHGIYGIYTAYLLYTDGELTEAFAPQIDMQIAAVHQSIMQLEETEQNLLSNLLVYRQGAPVYIVHGEVRPVSEAMITTIFARYGTREVYLPIAHFADRYLEYDWYRLDPARADLSLTMEPRDGEVYQMQSNDSDGPLIFRSIPFVGADTIERILPLWVLQIDEFVIVAPEGIDMDEVMVWAVSVLLLLFDSVV